ncbi:MAG: Bax inhibitor-1/YccA family protein [Microbacterium sp.]|uniref:Bax inhibitor-1/YccA family protein n=1 Tax=Microbacterium sp. TaxID=51671 RepID=UPI00272468F2|nr:Bax inhibitor-1/YccA family protein [Microbacterium sp.]MDO8382834.1 Bax inhibitor-1/YccA family protein [Microbacterium sp.]
MALNNPAFNNPAFQDPRAVQTYPGGSRAANLGSASQTASASRAGLDVGAQAQMEGAYAAPAAGAHQTDRMTVEDTVVKTVGLFAILIVTAVVGWVWTLGALSPAESTSQSILPLLIGALGGFVLAMVIIFTSRKKVRPALIFAYAALEGLFVGGISAIFEFQFPGIVVQATLATLAVVGVTLALFASGKIRASKKATKVFLIAMVGYLAFSLLNLVLMWTGVSDSAFGLRSEPSPLFGIPWGVLIGVFVVILAAYSLVLDFDQIQRGVRNGAPRQLAWMGAFGIMVTVVWLYVEILRIIAIARGNN